MELYLNMPIGNFYGWAVCGKNLLRELGKKTKVYLIEDGFCEQLRTPEDSLLVEKYRIKCGENVNGTVIHCLGPNFEPACKAWGKKNIGYLFHEKEELTPIQVENLKKYDVVLAGSRWGARVINKHGLRCGHLIQGVDRELFTTRPFQDNKKFVIFSGGKWEHRKGQDLVIEVVRRLQDKGLDVVLYYNWVNVFNFDKAEQEIKEALKGIKAVRIALEEHKNIADIMAATDIGLFPNRCEGGTNLVLMEYLATGRTAVVRTDTGQRDVVEDNYTYMVSGSDKDVVDASVSYLTYAYDNPKEVREMGRQAGEAMNQFTWEEMASRMIWIAKSWQRKINDTNRKDV